MLSARAAAAPRLLARALPAPRAALAARLASGGPWGKGTPLTMPALSPTMASGKIAKWNKKEGDEVSSGDVIAEIETDKATVDFVFQDDLILAKILLPEGSEDVAVGAPLAVMVEKAADVEEVRRMDFSAAMAGGAAAAAAPAPAAAAAAAASPASPPAPAAAAPGAAAAAVAALDGRSAMLSARVLMANEGVDPARLATRGSGKGGRITKGDVLALLGRVAAVETPAVRAAAPAAPTPAAPAPAAPAPAASSGAAYVRPGGRFSDEKPSMVRKVIASRLTESKAGVPHQYATIDVRLDALMALRGVLKEAGVNVSVNDVVIKAAARALVDVPEANCFYDAKADRVRKQGGVDVSVAVATDKGLITPIVKGADALGLAAINEKVKDLAGRARIGKLKPEEFQGGSFSVSNLGMFPSIDEFTAVINPPQACILAVGKGEKRVVLPPLTSFDDVKPGAPMPTPSIATVMTVQLSADARVVDAPIAASFLQAFRHYVQNPTLLVA